MGFRFWRRIKILPGVTLNISKKGGSLSFGPKGAKYTISPKGSRTTVGIPGTGLFYTTISKNKKGIKEPDETQGRFSGLGCSLILGLFLLLLSSESWIFAAIGAFFILISIMIFYTGITEKRQKNVEEIDNPSEHEGKPIEYKSDNHIVPEFELDEENTKKCPKCAEIIKKEAKICHFCGYEYPLIYILTIYEPKDDKMKHFLIKKIVEKKGKTYNEIAKNLKSGMVINYSDKDKFIKNKKAFESYGCSVQTKEFLKV